MSYPAQAEGLVNMINITLKISVLTAFSVKEKCVTFNHLCLWLKCSICLFNKIFHIKIYVDRYTLYFIYVDARGQICFCICKWSVYMGRFCLPFELLLFTDTLRVCVCVCVYIYIYNKCLNVGAYVYMHVYSHVYMHKYVHTNISMYVSVYWNLCVCANTCMLTMHTRT